MRHPLIDAVLADAELRRSAFAGLVNVQFDEILDFDLPEDLMTRDEFVAEVVDCAVKFGNPATALAEMYDRGNYTSGSVFEAFARLYDAFDDHIAMIVANRASAAGWRGPVDTPCIVDAAIGEREGCPYLAVPVSSLVSHGRAVVAMLDDDDRPERTDAGDIAWITMPWHHIRAIDDIQPAFDPERSSAEAYAAEFLAKAARGAVQREEARLDCAEIHLAGLPGETTLLDRLLYGSKSTNHGGDPSVRAVPPILRQDLDSLFRDFEGTGQPIATPFDQVMAELDGDLRLLRGAMAEAKRSAVSEALRTVRGRLNAIETLARVAEVGPTSS